VEKARVPAPPDRRFPLARPVIAAASSFQASIPVFSFSSLGIDISYQTNLSVFSFHCHSAQ
jgi:hypothetical protein